MRTRDLRKSGTSRCDGAGGLALLETLGFTRRQLLATVARQASVAATVGIVVGVPLGIVFGRWLWTLFAREIFAVPYPSDPLSQIIIIIVVVGALVLAILVAIPPGDPPPVPGRRSSFKLNRRRAVIPLTGSRTPDGRRRHPSRSARTTH